MKLNILRTVLVGLAFLSISAFWQMYDGIIPIILTNTFHMNETLSGIIMAADNILGLFLLPFFGSVSDRTYTGIGKRMPFIVCGTACAVILMNLLPLLDNRYYHAPNSGILVLFIILLGLLLITMGSYRSPAVSLMPDVTPKPLRSKANAIINLMGAAGGILYLALAAVLYPAGKTSGQAHVNYQPLFAAVSVIMATAVAILFFTLREPELAAENMVLETLHPEWNLTQDNRFGKKVLSGDAKRSFLFLLISIALWYMAYNGVATWFSAYISHVIGLGLGGASTCVLIATASAVVSYIPIGIISAKIGRRRTIQIGIILLTLNFAAGYYITTAFRSINIGMFLMFAFIGVGWAAINVNSLPMVVEMCGGFDIGKFTGYYYTASMAAQVITPVLAGTLMRKLSYRILFPYGAVFAGLSFITMLFVKHGDTK